MSRVTRQNNFVSSRWSNAFTKLGAQMFFCLGLEEDDTLCWDFPPEMPKEKMAELLRRVADEIVKVKEESKIIKLN